jgi:hypothetical protein
MRKERILLGALHTALSILYITAAFALCGIIYSRDFFSDGIHMSSVSTIVCATVALLLFLMALSGIIGGIGLMHNWECAQMIILIKGCMDLVCLPLGTALGIYTIMVYMHDNYDSQDGHPFKDTFNSADYPQINCRSQCNYSEATNLKNLLRLILRVQSNTCFISEIFGY